MQALDCLKANNYRIINVSICFFLFNPFISFIFCLDQIKKII